jgi:ABC-type Fe3+/spermidine/putrescine transport system ATPase subunit
MQGFGDRLPKNMSGGQQQRIALARALVIEPDLLLLDEPLSALDLKLREEMRDEIHRIVRSLGITTVFVTHDQGEALVLSDMVAVMNGGRVEQMASPREVYRNPATAFVADFIGGANVLRGRVDPGNPCKFLAEGLLPLALDKPLPPNAAALSIRPEDIVLRPAGAAGIEGTVRRSRFLGNALDYTIEIGGRRMVNVRTDGHSAHGEGDRVVLAIDTGKLTVLTEGTD